MKISNFKLKIIFFGSSHYVLPIIEVLNKNFDLVLVITTEKFPTDPIIAYCTRQKIPYVSISKSSELIKNLKPVCRQAGLKIENSILGVIADFRLIIPLQIINAFSKGILNIHPSLLPKYRGPTPVPTAILNSEKETGVSIIMLDEKVDHGNILFQKREQILPSDVNDSLCQKLFKIGAEILKKELKNYLNGKIKGEKQNDKDATYTRRLKKQDGYIDISNNIPKDKLERMIRAYYPWPGVWTRLRLGYGGQAKIVKFLPLSSHLYEPEALQSRRPELVSGSRDSDLRQNDKFLIQVEGGKPMSYKDFINGYSEGKKLLEVFKLI